jgi:hypothetical protein
VVPPADLDTLADDVVALEAQGERGLEASLQSFSRGFTVIRGKEQAAESTVRAALKDEFEQAERALQNIEMRARMGDFFAAFARLFGPMKRLP